MNITFLSNLASPSQFTGLEHARVIDLLSTLAIISIAVWIIVSLSIAIRFGVLIVIRRLSKRATRNIQTGGHDGR